MGIVQVGISGHGWAGSGSYCMAGPNFSQEEIARVVKEGSWRGGGGVDKGRLAGRREGEKEAGGYGSCQEEKHEIQSEALWQYLQKAGNWIYVLWSLLTNEVDKEIFNPLISLLLEKRVCCRLDAVSALILHTWRGPGREEF